MKGKNIKKEKRERRHAKIRARVSGTAQCPRLSIFKSNKHVLAQVIDDSSGKTLVASHSKEIKAKSMMEKAKGVGLDIAKKAKTIKIESVVFDRGGFKYTGAVKALADGAREGGLRF